jgi:hypothetical protein
VLPQSPVPAAQHEAAVGQSAALRAEVRRPEAAAQPLRRSAAV